MKQSFCVAAIDPGIANTGVGVVAFHNEIPTVLNATTIHTEAKSGNETRARAANTWERAFVVARGVTAEIASYAPNYIGFELFSDQGAARKQFAGRGDTALALGVMLAEIGNEFHVPMMPLDSAVVASKHGAMAEVVGMWKAGHSVYAGDERVHGGYASDHARDAVAHAIFLGREIIMADRMKGQDGWRLPALLPRS